MTNSIEQYTRDNFVACEWDYDVLPENHHGYSSVMQSLEKSANEKLESGEDEQSKILNLLSRSSSMLLVPNSLNDPFRPLSQDYQAGRRSALPEDFTRIELAFFEEILDEVTEPWLKARLADLLWLCKTPKNPNHAKVAIESYISHEIDPDTWHRDVNNCWERAARLCMQLRDYDKLDGIKNQLFAAFGLEHPRNKLMTHCLAHLMDKLKIDSDLKDDIASRLFKLGNELMEVGDFNSARTYFELSSKKYNESDDDKGWLDSLVSLADCFEREADSGASGSNIFANSFYENAIQAYRRIPTKYREDYNISYKINEIRKKVSTSGKASLGEMGMLKTPGVDISEIIEASRAHISGKQSPEEALMYFTGLYSGTEYSNLKSSAKESMQNSIISSLFGCTQMSSDGRVVAKTPPMNLNAGEDDPANQSVLNRQIQQQFELEIQIVVQGQILPALGQLLMEHRVSKELLETLCHHSPIVPQDRKYLLGYALWLGFEHDFRNAIHLLCPQIEHIVRLQLKEAGAHTSNFNQEGIENENGLSTLMELPEAVQIFGEDWCFELKSIFTDSLGFNLRNEVAHGLLNDNSSSSIPTIYAWWSVLRLVVRSLVSAN
jgi:tetratricopeptide (TPR) repeat protein